MESRDRRRESWLVKVSIVWLETCDYRNILFLLYIPLLYFTRDMYPNAVNTYKFQLHASMIAHREDPYFIDV